MTTPRARMIFPNLPVRDLEKTKAFFSALGFTFDPRFTDEKAAAMFVNEQAHVMLLAEPFFKTFTKKQICDTSTHTEGACSLQCESRAEVDEMVQKAIEAGGKIVNEPMDHGFMYQRGFDDLDGHHWEFFWMDPASVPPQS